MVIIVDALLAMGPLTLYGVRLAKKHRRSAYAAASLLLLFGVNSKVDPPPPPRIEAIEPEDEAEQSGEAK